MNCFTDVKMLRSPVIFLAFSLLPLYAASKTVVVKMATLAPDGSPWHEILVEMGQQWYEVTGGDVEVRIYPDGVAGDERHMIRKIRIGQIHAAAVTIEGLTEISKDMNVFFIPLLVSSFEELDLLRKEMEPHLSSELEKNGFILLSWADVGWAYWFTREPIRTPHDLMELRIFSWAGDYRWAELWKLGGFEPVSLSSVDVLPSLQTGLVDAFATTPMVALSMQWFALAPHMFKLKWGPMIGAVIISKETWNAIPSEYHSDLLEISEHAEERARSLLPQAEKAIDSMQQHGLEIHTPTQEEKDMWLQFTKSFYPHLRGNLVPEEIFDRAVELQKQLSRQENSDN